MNRIINSSITNMKSSKLKGLQVGRFLLYLGLLYSLFEEFYIGPSLGKTLTWVLIYLICELVFRRKIKVDKYGKLIITLLFAIMLQMILTIIIYATDPIEIVYANRWYIYLLIYFVLDDFSSNECEWERLLKWFLICAIIMSVLVLIQGYVRSYGSQWFLNEAAQDTVNNSLTPWRNGRVRLRLCACLRTISLIYSWSCLITASRGNLKYLNITNLIVTGASSLLFDSTRITNIIVFIIAIMSLFSVVSIKRRKQIIVLIVGFILLLVLLVFNSSNSSFQVDFSRLFRVSTEEGSWYARISSYPYFIKMLFYRPFVGIGMITEVSFPGAYQILHGPLGLNYASDVGIIGTLAISGLFATIIYLYIVFIVIRDVGKRKANMWSIQHSFVLFILLCLVTISMLTRDYIYGLPFCLCIIKKESAFAKKHGVQ